MKTTQTKTLQANKRPLLYFGALAICLGLILSTLTITAYGAVKNVTASLSPQTKIVVDGVSQTFYNVSGAEVQPILYNNTIYLPVRSIGELMGKNTNWDESSLTLTISGTRTAPKVTGTPDNSATSKEITAQIRPDFTIVVDGVTQNFKDSNGDRVYPLLYNGTTYLPLRATGELMGKTVAWDSKTNTATLTSGTNSSVTDADSFGKPTNPTNPTNPANPSQPTTNNNQTYIGEAKAKEIALKHAGVSSSKVTFVHNYLEKDDGQWKYDIEFYTSDYQEYDYEINAYTGAILSFDYDAENYQKPTDSKPSTGSDSYIGEAKAKEIALSRAGLSASSISAYKCQLDRDDGVAVYEIEFKAGGYDYEVDINATTGKIIKYDKEWD